MQLDSKTAIVTGAASGFGHGIARAFAAAGARVMVADINGEGAAEVAREIGGISAQVDVSNATSVQAMADEAFAQLGHIDILVNNAGVTHLPQALEEVSEDEFDRVLADVPCSGDGTLRKNGDLWPRWNGSERAVSTVPGCSVTARACGCVRASSSARFFTSMLSAALPMR